MCSLFDFRNHARIYIETLGDLLSRSFGRADDVGLATIKLIARVTPHLMPALPSRTDMPPLASHISKIVRLRAEIQMIETYTFGVVAFM